VALPQSRLPGLYLWTHPAVQAHVIMEATGGRQNADLPWNKVYYDSAHVVYHPGNASVYFGVMTRVLVLVSILYILVGLLFFWRAKRRLRQNVFG